MYLKQGKLGRTKDFKKFRYLKQRKLSQMLKYRSVNEVEQGLNYRTFCSFKDVNALEN